MNTPWLQRLGDGMRRHARLIRGMQWAVVLFYAGLLVVPALLPLPAIQGVEGHRQTIQVLHRVRPGAVGHGAGRGLGVGAGRG